MTDVCYLKHRHCFWTMGGGAITLCAQCILRRGRRMVALSELLALISIAFGFTETQLNKILIQYQIVMWL